MQNKKNSSLIAGIMMAAGAAVIWGTAGTAQTFISAQGPDPYWVASLRLCFSLCFFWPLFALTRKTQASASVRSLSSGRMQASMLLAALAMIVYNVCFFTGVKAIGVALGAAVIIGSSPIWAGLLNLIFKKQFPKKLWVLGTLVAVLGGFLMAFARAFSVELSPWGFAVCLLAGFSYVSYAMIAQDVVMQQGPVKATAGIFTRAAVLGLPLAFVASGTPHIVMNDLLVVAYLGIVTTGCAYWFFSEALKRIDSATGVAMTLMEPVTAFILSITIVGEAGSWIGFAGLLVILLGLSLIMVSDSQKN